MERDLLGVRPNLSKKIGFTALSLLSIISEQSRIYFCSTNLRCTPPLVHFSTQEVNCPSNNGKLKVKKTK